MHLVLEALDIGPGDEVITTMHTFTATAEVVRYLGADVVRVDFDPATLCIDARGVDAAITPATRAIMPAHYAGLAVDMHAILDIARRHGLKVVEEAAHALPTTCGGALIGTLGFDVTVFSLGAVRAAGHGWAVMALVDGDPAKRGSRIGGIPVQGPLTDLLLPHIPAEATHVIVAMPGATAEQRAAAIAAAKKVGLQVLTVPSQGELQAQA